jgi:filamentous hemagglutinin family protein
MNLMKIGQRVLMKSIHSSVEQKKSASQVKNSSSNKNLIKQMRRPGRGLVFLVSFLTYLLGIFPSLVYALPTNGAVKLGSAKINQVSDSRLNISQSSNKSIIDWNSFNIAEWEHVNVQVPSATSVTLNRVTGNDPSLIFGKLSSNGNLMLINRNGILFGNGAEIDVHSLVATTSDMSNGSFMNGQYHFNISPEFSNTITNHASITAAEGGLVAFVAPGIQNT